MAAPTPVIDPHSDTWAVVKTAATMELARCATTLETPGIDIARTENIRGRIGVLRMILALHGAPPARPIGFTDNYGL
jgi:hypothetical protein